MIDRSSTALEWGTARTDLLFLPVGAFEQHSLHLPLDTDCKEAEYFARIAAEHFGGALLPVQAIASSLEHTGWRGVFTLKPETFMSVIRDIACCAEMQNYKVLIIINAHGGNFPLGPVCRDWNRHDRKLKILLFDPFQYLHGVKRSDRMDMHAGESETSIMMHICGKEFPLPEKVVQGNVSTLKQSDLNTFGVGWLNPNGLPGYPEDASFEKGKKFTAIMTEGLLKDIEERLALLQKNPRYCGTGGLFFRKGNMDDLPQLLALSESVNWDQIAADWQIFLQKGEVWTMIHLNRIVACAAWVPRSKEHGWIGMVVTRPEWRGCAIAPRLIQKILAETASFRGKYLDATAAGAHVYAKLGFTGMYKVFRMECQKSELSPANKSILDWSEGEPDAYIPLEFNFTGKKETMEKARFSARWGRQSFHIGAIRADNPVYAMDAFLYAANMAESRIMIDVPEYQQSFIHDLQNAGLTIKREFLRMKSANSPEIKPDQHEFAVFGAEFG